MTTEVGKGAIENILKDPENNTLHHHLRRLIRDNQGFLPQAATSLCDLALEVLKTNRGNLVCCYHQIAKGGVTVDGEGKYKVNGQPFDRKLRKKLADLEVI